MDKNSFSQRFENWQSPEDFLHIKTLDCHTAGEPLRIITSGFPELLGQSILEKRQYCKDNYDYLRKALIFEPRGHADMYGTLIVEPENSDSHFGALFIHNEGYSTMCGHAVIALVKFAVESGVVTQTGEQTSVVIDVPCGQIKAIAYGAKEIEKVSFECVPSFVLYQDQEIEIENFSTVKLDVAFGGAFYAYLNVSEVGLTCDAANYNQLISMGRRIKQAVNDSLNITHPLEGDLSFLYGTIFIEDSKDSNIHSKNVCIFADGEVDRSPTGSGVSGRAAIHYAKNEIALNQEITVESILATKFQVEVVEEIEYFGHKAVIPKVTGQAFISGKSEFIIDPNDPLKDGFILR